MSRWSASASMAHVMRSASGGWPGRSAEVEIFHQALRQLVQHEVGELGVVLGHVGQAELLSPRPRGTRPAVVAGSKCSATNASVSSGVRQLRIFHRHLHGKAEASPSFRPAAA